MNPFYQRPHCMMIRVLGKSTRAQMHETIEVVGLLGVHRSCLANLEVGLLVRFDVVPANRYPLVTIRSVVLIVEAHYVHQLVHQISTSLQAARIEFHEISSLQPAYEHLAAIVALLELDVVALLLTRLELYAAAFSELLHRLPDQRPLRRCFDRANTIFRYQVCRSIRQKIKKLYTH